MHCNFSVAPRMPPSLECLRRISMNIWWSWHPEARDAFASLDPELWEACGHSPASLLRRIAQSRLVGAARDETFVLQVERIERELQAYLDRRFG